MFTIWNNHGFWPPRSSMYFRSRICLSHARTFTIRPMLTRWKNWPGKRSVSSMRWSWIWKLNSYSNSMIPDTTPDVIPKYPYLPFSICLDRRRNSKEEILDGIERTMQQLAQADQGESIPEDAFDRSAYNTSFLYQLRDERSRVTLFVLFQSRRSR